MLGNLNSPRDSVDPGVESFSAVKLPLRKIRTACLTCSRFYRTELPTGLV